MPSTETTLVYTKPSRLLVLKHYIAAIFLVVLAAILFFQAFGIRLPGIGSYVEPSLVNLAAQLLLVLLALALLLKAEAKRYSTRYLITDFRIIRRDGILRTSETVFPYRQLERVQLSQGILERIFGIGTIVVDTGEDQLLIAAIPNPRKVQQAIMDRVQRVQLSR